MVSCEISVAEEEDTEHETGRPGEGLGKRCPVEPEGEGESSKHD